jgi:hypothetical protein
MSYLGFYILAKLNDIGCVLSTLSIIGFIFCAIAIIPIALTADTNSSYSDPDKSFNKLFKQYQKDFMWYKVFTVSAVFLTIATLLPTTKQAAFIWIAPQIVENGAVKDTVKNMPELTKLGTDYLKELLKEKINDSGRTN